MSFADMQMVCRRRVEFIRINCETMPNRVDSFEAPLAKCQRIPPHATNVVLAHVLRLSPGTATHEPYSFRCLKLGVARTNSAEVCPCGTLAQRAQNG